jgi:hypothetical protein
VHRLRKEVKVLKKGKEKLKRMNMLGKSLLEVAENLMKLLDKGHSSKLV